MYIRYEFEGKTRIEQLDKNGVILGSTEFNVDSYPKLKQFCKDLEKDYATTTANICDQDTSYRVIVVSKTGRVFSSEQDHGLAFVCDTNGDMRTISLELKNELQTLMGIV